MKISRWKMICGLKYELFGVLTWYLMILLAVILVITEDYSKKSINIAIIGVAVAVFFYLLGDFGYVADIILKNIGKTDWITDKNIKYCGTFPAIGIPAFGGHIIGGEIKVFEEGKKTKKLKIYNDLASWPDGQMVKYKIYYLKICKAVVGWEVVPPEKNRIDFSRKPRKSK